MLIWRTSGLTRDRTTAEQVARDQLRRHKWREVKILLPVSLTITRIGSPYSIGALSLLNMMTTLPYKRNNTKYSNYTHARGYELFNKYVSTHTHIHTSLIPAREDQYEWRIMTRVADPDYVAMHNLIITHNIHHTLAK